MSKHELIRRGFVAVPLVLLALPAGAQSFRVQCPTSTITHPDPKNAGINNSERPYTATTYSPVTGTAADYTSGLTGPVNGAIKCQQISGGDGYATMGDGTQTYMFSFGPLSGLVDIANGLPGTEFPNTFNMVAATPLQPGDPATTGLSGPAAFKYNGAIGLAGNVPHVASIFDASESGTTVEIVLNTSVPFSVNDVGPT